MLNDILGLIVIAVMGLGVYWIGGHNRDKKRDKDQRDAEQNTLGAIRGAVRPDLSDDDVADSLRKHAK